MSDPGLYPSRPAQGSARPSALLLPWAALLALLRVYLPPATTLLQTIPPSTSSSTRAITSYHVSLNCVLAPSLPNWCVGVSRGDGGLYRPHGWPEPLDVGFPREGAPAPARLGLHFNLDPSPGESVTTDFTFPRSFAPAAAGPQQSGPQHLSARLLESSSRWQHRLHRHPLRNQVPEAGQEHDCGQQLD